LQFDATVRQWLPQIAHLSHRSTPTNTCPIKISKNGCFGYALYECHANFHINWGSTKEHV
jgi:hypothetical protein